MSKGATGWAVFNIGIECFSANLIIVNKRISVHLVKFSNKSVTYFLMFWNKDFFGTIVTAQTGMNQRYTF